MQHNPGMAWIGKLLGKKPAAEPDADASRFEDSDRDEEQGARNASRREVVHVVLRDTMRKHGIPSDWIEDRVLSVVNREGVSSTHVQFIVRGGEERLMAYVHAFQDSFRRELVRVEPRAKEWLRSLSWEFQGAAPGPGAMPDPASWSDEVPTQPGGPGAPEAPETPEAVHPPGAPAVTAAPGARAAPEASGSLPRPHMTQSEHDELSKDLEALFAIRDQALRQDASPPAADFQPTLPGARDNPRQS